jgi:predicted ATPase/class 3 adenylate cyclase/DNA-binding CsgD family transcriptional regulator
MTLHDRATERWDELALTGLLADGPVVPEGTVTFLLTDVERSTQRWQAEPDAMAAAIARHYELLDEVVTAHHGVRPVEQGEGDSIVAAFAKATDAIRAALDAQRYLQAEAWPTATPLTVRMAVHTGEARLRDEGNYVGGSIVRTARLRAIAHGGQVLVSSSTHDLVVDDLPAGVELVDLGTQRLKDLTRPEHVWQLAHPDLASAFPPLASVDRVPNNLPIALSTFVGRFDEIDTVVRLVLDNRLVNLMGPGGAGKTRLAQQVGAELVESFPDGVWWVDLVDVQDASLLPSAISRAAQLPEDREDRLGGLARRLTGQRALIILDNCEHVVDAAADAAAHLLSRGADLSILVTSRAPLNVPGELSWRVPPLGLPASEDVLEVVARGDAVRLFVDRATRARREFRLTEENAGDVVAICRRLDGIPLAIELAAARCRMLSPAQIAAGLTDAFGVLASGPRTVDARHRTIECSIEWSHAMLAARTQTVFRRLGALSAPFTLEAAVAVASGDGIEPSVVVEELEQLIDQSLLQMDEHGSEARFSLLETVRQYARRALVEAGESDAVAARHAAHFRARALGLWPLFHDGLGALLDRADAEHADLVAMLTYLERHASPEEHAEVAMACLPAIGVRHLAEVVVLGDAVAARVDETSALGGHLHLRLALADPTMPTHVQIALAAAEATGDPELTALATYWGSWNEAGVAPTREAVARLEDARIALVHAGEEHFSRTHWSPAALHRGMGRHVDAIRHTRTAVEETACKRCNVMVWSEATLLALSRGDLGAAEAALERAQVFALEVRDAGFSMHVRLSEVEVAAYAGKAWPAPEVEAELAAGATAGNPLLGYLFEARALGSLVDGLLAGVDEDSAAAIAHLDDMWSKRTDVRLRLAAAHHARGDLPAAAEVVAELEEMAARWDGGPVLLAQIAHRAAALALDQGDVGAADELAHRALAEAATGPWSPVVVTVLELLASVAVARESHTEAARLAGAAAHLRDEIGFRCAVDPERARLARDLATVRASLGDADLEAAVSAGHRLTIDDAIAYARRARGERKRPSHGWDGLTPMERQVVDLAITGMSNAQIAEQLFIGRETVKTHLSNAYAKVGVANRAQLVADAAKHGIT